MIIAYVVPPNKQRGAMPQHVTTSSLDEIAAKLKDDFEASKNGFAENMVKLKGDFEASNTKFNADLDAISPRKPKARAKPNSSGKWILARKVWSWLYRD
jgi:hypothetical protein